MSHVPGRRMSETRVEVQSRAWEDCLSILEWAFSPPELGKELCCYGITRSVSECQRESEARSYEQELSIERPYNACLADWRAWTWYNESDPGLALKMLFCSLP